MNKAAVDTVGVVVHGHGNRYPMERQKVAIAPERPRATFQLGGKDGLSIERLWQRSTANRTFVVEWLFLVCTVRGSAKTKRNLVLQFVDEVQDRGGEILEAGSGRSTKTSKERRAMLSDAFEAVTRGRMPSMSNHRGRPERKWSDAQKKVVAAAWLSHDYATNGEASAAASEELGFQVSDFQCWTVMRDIRHARGDKKATGASGRPWKSKKSR